LQKIHQSAALLLRPATRRTFAPPFTNYRKLGLFVGSGVVEAGCKTVICKRLKQSGMQWTVRGANAIISIRCCHLSGRLEEFWEQRAG